MTFARHDHFDIFEVFGDGRKILCDSVEGLDAAIARMRDFAIHSSNFFELIQSGRDEAIAMFLGTGSKRSSSSLAKRTLRLSLGKNGRTRTKSAG
jgi:hypothetical protein